MQPDHRQARHLSADYGLSTRNTASVEAGDRPRIGQVCLVIDPGALAGTDVYNERVKPRIYPLTTGDTCARMSSLIFGDEGVRVLCHRRDGLARSVQIDGLEVPDFRMQMLRAAS